MRFHIILAAAPLALLAACADNDADDADTAMVEADTAATTDGGATATSNPSGRATTLAEAGDYSGSYSFTGPDGTATDLMLDTKARTYRYTDASGKVRTGSYILDDDGYRLSIADYYGAPGWFVISDGELVRLSTDTPVTSEITVSGDRYAPSENARFTREPEIGSPVGPDPDQ